MTISARTLQNNKAKGARYERDVCEMLTEELGQPVERRRLEGQLDRGDVAGIPGLIIECKNEKAWKVWQWLREAKREAAVETIRSGKPALGVVFKRQVGFPDPADSAVLMDVPTFLALWEAYSSIRESGKA